MAHSFSPMHGSISKRVPDYCCRLVQEIFEEETSVRLRGGVHRGPTIRQRRLPAGQYQGDDNSPETMRLLSSGDPVPHAVTRPYSLVVVLSFCALAGRCLSDVGYVEYFI